MVDEIMAAIAKNDYERIARIDLLTKQMQVIHYGEADIEVWDYSERAEKYSECAIYKGDRELFVQCTALSHIVKELEDKDSYEFVCRFVKEGEQIRYCLTRYFYYDANKNVCVMTRADITDVILQEEERKSRLETALKQKKEADRLKEKLEQDRQMLMAALFTLVPMVISVNVTKNFYSMLNYDTYTTKKAALNGTYEELIAVGKSTVPDEQKDIFARTFSKENLIKEYNKGAKSVRLEHQQWGDDGVLRWIDTNCIFVENPEGDLCTITLAQDITKPKEQRIELQKALKAAQTATQAKSEFLSRMSHEIRTPMNAIMGMTAIAKENRSDFLQVDDCLNKIDSSSHYLLTLLNDILEMSRIESGRTSIAENEFDFNALMEGIRTIIETLAAQNSIRYECVNIADTSFFYQGDRMRIQQVIVNIITNAIKFTKSGGRVRFTASTEEIDSQNTMIHFCVEDTGIGMSDEFMNRMFKPFTQEDGSNTSKYQGSGLGLAISKNLVELMGGNINVESILGIGSTFNVNIPLRRIKKNESHIVPEKRMPIHFDESVLAGCHVLVAEDHPMNIVIIKKLLKSRKVNVTVAENGRQAVELFEASEPGFYDVILMDIRMPIMDGLDATKKIRSLNREDAKTTPIVAMTANALDEDRQKTKEVGMNAHLAKPFEPKDLYQTLIGMMQR